MAFRTHLLFSLTLLWHSFYHWSIDESRNDGIAANVVAAHLPGHRPREALHGALARHVVHLAEVGDLRADAAEVDDGAPVTTFRIHYPLAGGLCRQEGALHVDVHHLAEGLLAHPSLVMPAQLASSVATAPEPYALGTLRWLTESDLLTSTSRAKCCCCCCPLPSNDTVSLAFASDWSATMTEPPCLAISCAAARPIPEPPPVMMAIRLANMILEGKKVKKLQ
ncbi:hypothetical protein TYRP_006832 [Tyrophagus putrescentiae]|nr:hypothetical protein TYRP_006832 [Tyrophagus putrescentiae]